MGTSETLKKVNKHAKMKGKILIILNAIIALGHASSYGDNNFVPKRNHDGETYGPEAALALDINHYHETNSVRFRSRPVAYNNETLVVKFGLRLSSLIGFDGKDGVLKVGAQKYTSWENKAMTWDACDYGDCNVTGLTEVRIPPTKVWVPDITLLNAISTTNHKLETMDRVKMTSKGEFTGAMPWVYETPCSMVMRDFPFDVQTCVLKFGPLVSMKREITMEPYFTTASSDGVGVMTAEGYSANNEWLLEKVTTEDVSIIKNEETYQEYHIKIKIKRFSGFYFQFVLIPTFMLATLILTIYWIPASRADRTGLGMSVFTGLMVLLLMVVRVSPPGTDVKIGTYYMINICLVAMGTIVSAVVVSISRRNGPMNRKVRNFAVLKLGKFFGILSQYERLYPSNDKNDRDKTALRDWITLACVIDRIVFFSVILILIASVVCFFPYPKEGIAYSAN